MTPSMRRALGAVLAAAALLAGCNDPSGKGPATEAQAKPDLARSLMDAASQALTQGDAATAATYFRGVHTREPDNIQATLGLIQSLRLAGGLDEAREVAAKALKAKPDDPAFLAAAGKVTLATGQAREAIKYLEKAAAADAEDWRARSALGLDYDRLGDYDRADRSYQAALEISPDNAAVLNNFALSRAMAGDLDGARGMAQRAAAAVGADLRVKQNLALIYALSGNMAKAEELTRRDLPPAVARETIEYYRELVAASTPQRP
jgi:Flp pilus assembly protein TadD